MGAPSSPGAETSLPRALPPPRLEVVPPAPIVGWLAPAVVTAHARLGADGPWRLDLRTDAGADVAVTYDLGAGRPLPVAGGDAVAVRYFADASPGSSPSVEHRSAGAATPRALVVATRRGQALAVLTVSGGLPGGVLPGGASVRRGDTPDRVAYTEVRRLASLCLARIEHSDLALVSDEAAVWVAPGGVARVSLAGSPFDLIAYDASRLVDERCAADDPSHTSWALVAPPVAPKSDLPGP